MTAPAGYDPSAYPPLAVTVDIAVFTVRDGRMFVSLIQRASQPYAGALALPGGFVDVDESLEAAAARELAEETGHRAPHLEQLAAYGEPDRDPRMRVVSVGYWAIVPGLGEPVAGSDAAAARLVAVDEALSDPTGLAFDHHQILGDALEQARHSLEHTTLATSFCPPEFTIGDLRGIYEAVWGRPLDPGDFQKGVIETTGFVEPTGRQRRGGQSRPAELYRAGPAEVLDPPMRRASSP